MWVLFKVKIISPNLTRYFFIFLAAQTKCCVTLLVLTDIKPPVVVAALSR